MRVVLDTNVWVSGLLVPHGKSGLIVDAWRQGHMSVVVSQYIFQEIERVLLYPKISKRLKWDIEKIKHYINLLALLTEEVDVNGCPVVVQKDLDDSPILATLIVAQADWLVTGDAVLLELQEEYPIISVSDFFQKMSFQTQ
ncbi:MAG: putative toxin-antitoxin system toxin component, PIN family [Alphaproteobacteria bacterium]